MDVTLIKEFEGCELEAYEDVVGVWTIGYGCTFYLDSSTVKKGDKLTSEAEAEELLLHVIEQDFFTHFAPDSHLEPDEWQSKSSRFILCV